MADSLVLRGLNVLRDVSGDGEVTLDRPNTGREQFLMRKWWGPTGVAAGSTKSYVKVTRFSINRGGPNYKLCIAATKDAGFILNTTATKHSLFPSCPALSVLPLAMT